MTKVAGVRSEDGGGAVGDRPSVLDVLEGTVDGFPGREAIVDGSARLTYAELWTNVRDMAQRLERSGIAPGDRVAVCLPNDASAVIAFLSTLALGAIWVGVNPQVPLAEQQQLLRLGAVGTLLTRGRIAEGLTSSGTARTVVDLDDVAVPTASPSAVWTTTPRPTWKSPAVIAFTSGTTGTPKAVVHSHWNLLLPGYFRVATRRLGARPRMGVCLPLSIANVLALGPVFTIQAASTCVIIDSRRAGDIAQVIEAEGITTISLPPAIVLDLARRPEIRPESLSTLERPSTGGAGCSDLVKAEFKQKFGVDVARTYGLTELPTVAAIEDWDAPAPSGSSGRLLPYLRATVVDNAGATQVKPRIGEICLAAATEGEWAGWYTPMLGEWRGGGLEPYAGGPLRTGDIGHVGDDGAVFIVDRKKSIINRGGANVSPAEVERVLGSHPGVSRCIVLGAADERLGERVVALVVGDSRGGPEAAGLLQLCGEKLAHYKIPSEVILVSQLPVNGMDKVDRGKSAKILDELLSRRPNGAVQQATPT